MRQMVFWDAWAFIALADKGFRYYQEARGVKQQLQMEEAFLVTTEAVLSEVGNAFSKVKLRHLAIQQIEFAYDAEHTGNGKIASVPTDLWIEPSNSTSSALTKIGDIRTASALS